MVRIRGASLVGVFALALVAAACSATTVGGGNGGGSRVALRQRPAADAVPTTTAVPAGPTTALPNWPTVPTAAPAPTAVATTVAPATAYTTLVDDTGMLTVEVPTSWTDYDLGPFVDDDGTVRPGMAAATDLEAFDEEWSAPGMVFTAFHFQPDPNVLFGQYDFTGTCTDGGTAPYADGVFNGFQRTFTACDDAGSTNYVIVANAPGNIVTIVLIVQTVTAADQATYQHILETFNIDPNVSMPTETVPPATTAPLPTAAVPTVAVPTVAVPTVPVSTVPVPTSPALPTSPLLTAPATVPVVTIPTPTAPGPTTPSTGTAANGVPAGYQEISDETGRLSVQVPSAWIDIDGASAVDEGVEVAALSAAPNLTTFRETFDGPGLLVHETPFEADPAAELARRGLAGTCTAGPVAPNPNPAFTGVYQSWLDCGGTTTDWHVLVANPIDGRPTTVVMVVQTLTPADEEALKVVFSSYRLNTTV